MNPVADSVGLMPRKLIENLIGASQIIDVGVVTATDQTTVDVQHAVIPVKYGQSLSETVTRKVEVLWPFPGTWVIQNGDPVLLVGLKDYVQKVQGVSVDTTDVPLHYTQETMKAVPIYPSARAAVIKVDSAGMFQIKNAAASLYTVIQTLIQGIQGATAGGNPIVDTTTNIAQALVQLGQILKA